MRVITWNIHGATEKSPAWQYFLELDPDVSLLQEVGEIPKEVRDRFNILSRTAIYKTGRPQRFSTAVILKGQIISELNLISEYDWVNNQLDFLKGNFVGCIANIPNIGQLTIVSVYSPAWPVDKSKLIGIDISTIKLKVNPDLWATEILWSALQKAMPKDENWIIGGDFNSSETFDKVWQKKNGVKYGLQSSGNKEILDRMTASGFKECLRKFNKDKIIPTFKHSSGEIAHQLDHLFVTNKIYSRLNNCRTGESTLIFDRLLSDHLPIIAEFNGFS